MLRGVPFIDRSSVSRRVGWPIKEERWEGIGRVLEKEGWRKGREECGGRRARGGVSGSDVFMCERGRRWCDKQCNEELLRVLEMMARVREGEVVGGRRIVRCNGGGRV